MADATAATTEALAALVAFDTVSHRSNLLAVHWLADRFESAGARLRLTHDGAGQKANLLAIFGPDRDGGVVLSGHTDVVPVEGQVWDTDPFRLTDIEGRLVARGAVDMKGFVAACVAAAPGWGASTLRRPILLALTYDEEVGCFGVPRLIADMLAHAPRPALAIVGEPTAMRIGLRHRGFCGMQTRFEGMAAHSGEPERGASAIAAAAAFVTRLSELSGSSVGDDPERTTCNVGLISGGTGINVVPARCDVTWECRPGSQAAEDSLVGKAETWTPPDRINMRTETLVRVPALHTSPDSSAVTHALQWGAIDRPFVMPFGTEAGFFHEAGIPTVVCGPGSIHQAHQPNEWIDPAQLGAADLFLRRLTQWARQSEGQ